MGPRKPHSRGEGQAGTETGRLPPLGPASVRQRLRLDGLSGLLCPPRPLSPLPGGNEGVASLTPAVAAWRLRAREASAHLFPQETFAARARLLRSLII